MFVRRSHQDGSHCCVREYAAFHSQPDHSHAPVRLDLCVIAILQHIIQVCYQIEGKQAIPLARLVVQVPETGRVYI